MWKRASLISCLFVCAIGTLWTICFARITNADVQTIINKVSQKKQFQAAPALSTTTQNRKGVVKDVFFSQESGPRLHHRILSDTSVLYLIPQGNSFDLVEKLKGVHCWMQDKVSQEEQQVRFLQAEEGFYRFSSQEFLAQNVSLSLYRLPGTTLPQNRQTLTPFLNGLAKSVNFSFAGKTPQFQADQFKASLPSSSQQDAPL